MIKITFALRRLPTLTREEFQRYWLEQHGPLVRSHGPTLGLRRYVQSDTLADEMSADLASPRGAPEAYDGVAELCFDDVEALAAAASSDEGRRVARVLIEDERRFIDHSRSPIFLSEEHELVAG